MSYEEYLKSPEWQARRAAVLERDKHRCRLCRSWARVNVHHNTYERVGNEDMADLITLCRTCHKIHHGVMPTPADFPPPKWNQFRGFLWALAHAKPEDRVGHIRHFTDRVGDLSKYPIEAAALQVFVDNPRLKAPPMGLPYGVAQCIRDAFGAGRGVSQGVAVARYIESKLAEVR